jgi:replicative DNA helicase
MSQGGKSSYEEKAESGERWKALERSLISDVMRTSMSEPESAQVLYAQASGLRPDDFTDLTANLAWRVMQSLAKDGQDVTAANMLQIMTARKTPDDMIRAVLDLPMGGSIVSTVEPSVERLKWAAQLRVISSSFYLLADRAEKALVADAGQPGEFLGEAGSILANAANRSMPFDAIGGAEIRSVGLEEYRLRSEKAGLVGITSGMNALDEKTGGFRPKNLYLFGAWTGDGKSAMAANFAIAAARAEKRALMFSLELTKEVVATRIIANVSGVRIAARDPEANFRRGQGSEWLDTATVYLCDKSRMGLDDIRFLCARQKLLGGGLDVVIIDHIQHVSSPSGSARMAEWEKLRVVAEGLEDLSRDMNIPVIATAQMNLPPPQKGETMRPTLDQIRGGKEPANVAAFAGLLWIRRERGTGAILETQIIVAKNRHGELGTAVVRFDGGVQRFLDESPPESPSDQGSFEEGGW